MPIPLMTLQIGHPVIIYDKIVYICVILCIKFACPSDF